MPVEIRVHHLRQTLIWTAEAIEQLRRDLAAAAVDAPSRCDPVFTDPPPPPYDQCGPRWHRDERISELADRLSVTVRACADALEGLDPNLVVRPGLDDN